MRDNNVRELPSAKALPENPIQVERDKTFFCAHDSIVIHQHDRAIECKKCGAALDAFDYLLRQGESIQRAWESHREVRDRVEALNESLVKLQREEKRLKAAIRRAQDKVGITYSPKAPL